MRAGASRIRVLRGWLGAALVACTALVAAGCGSSSTHTAAAAAVASPACLPSSLVKSARLAGTDVDVSPAPGSGTANPATSISFVGTPAARIHAISVVGARSGNHAGHLHAYSQGDGGSFVPQTPFQEGERVTVRAVVGATPVSFAFRVDYPYSTASTGQFPNPAAAPADVQSFYTLPGVQAPVLTVTVPDRDPGAGDILTTAGPGPGRYGALIYTPQGRLVWFDQLSGGLVAEDLNVQTYDGQRDLTLWQGKVLTLGFGEGEDVVMNSHYQTVAVVHGGNGLTADLHEFQLAPNDVAYITAFDPIRCNLGSLGGAHDGAIIDNAIQEIDLKTGLVRWQWDSLDHVGASDSQFQAAQNSRPWDWFHLNSIDPEANGDLLISARNTWAEYQLQAGTGTILWRLGGLDSSFTMGPGTETAWQHDARLLPDGEISLFDDGSNPPVHSQSRAIRIALDFKTHRARLASVYTHPAPPLLGASQGNMQTLPDGNAVVDFGGVPAVSEFAKNGSLVFDAHLPFDMASYRGYRFPWSAAPLTPPVAFASLNNTDEETIVHASWNGATAVAQWRVLAGAKQGAMQPQTTVQAISFETTTILPKAYARVAVEALDSAGHVLGTSHAVSVVTFNQALQLAGSSK